MFNSILAYYNIIKIISVTLYYQITLRLLIEFGKVSSKALIPLLIDRFRVLVRFVHSLLGIGIVITQITGLLWHCSLLLFYYYDYYYFVYSFSTYYVFQFNSLCNISKWDKLTPYLFKLFSSAIN